jgi:hypothetical protein
LDPLAADVCGLEDVALDVFLFSAKGKSADLLVVQRLA